MWLRIPMLVMPPWILIRFGMTRPCLDHQFWRRVCMMWQIISHQPHVQMWHQLHVQMFLAYLVSNRYLSWKNPKKFRWDIHCLFLANLFVLATWMHQGHPTYPPKVGTVPPPSRPAPTPCRQARLVGDDWLTEVPDIRDNHWETPARPVAHQCWCGGGPAEASFYPKCEGGVQSFGRNCSAMENKKGEAFPGASVSKCRFQ